MIALHRLTQPDKPLYLNSDLIQSVEATPDTVVCLTNESKFVVRESPAEVVELVRRWQSSILARGLEVNGGAPVPQLETAGAGG